MLLHPFALHCNLIQKMQILYQLPFGSSVAWENRQHQRAEGRKGKCRRWALVPEGGGSVSDAGTDGDI